MTQRRSIVRKQKIIELARRLFENGYFSQFLRQAEIIILEILHFTGRSFSFRVEEHEVDRIPVKIYNPAKTVADCFKFRNKVRIVLE
jgi:hypothetical protein